MKATNSKGQESPTPSYYKETDVLGLEKQEIHLVKAASALPEETPEPDFPLAGLGLRVVAGIIDSMLFVIPWVAEMLVFEISYSISALIFPVLLGYTLYFGLMESSGFKASIGKSIVGIKVVNAKGDKLSFVNASLRFIVSLISIIPLGMGIWAIAFDKKKQAWHDQLMDTYVVKE
jgi:uncharacterized RDD family membrane protein YckC